MKIEVSGMKRRGVLSEDRKSLLVQVLVDADYGYYSEGKRILADVRTVLEAHGIHLR